jgi:hypothetical protein
MTCDNAAEASRLVVCIDPPNQNPHELSLSREVTKPLVAHHKVSSYPSILTNADGSVTFCQQNKTDIISSDGLMIQQTAYLWNGTLHNTSTSICLREDGSRFAGLFASSHLQFQHLDSDPSECPGKLLLVRGLADDLLDMLVGRQNVQCQKDMMCTEGDISCTPDNLPLKICVVHGAIHSAVAGSFSMPMVMLNNIVTQKTYSNSKALIKQCNKPPAPAPVAPVAHQRGYCTPQCRPSSFKVIQYYTIQWGDDNLSACCGDGQGKCFEANLNACRAVLDGFSSFFASKFEFSGSKRQGDFS